MARRIARKTDFQHTPPRKQVLLLSCMDSRLLDDTVVFMNEYNLANRYDQVVFAGAALGVLRLNSPTVTASSHSTESVWKDVFFHHLQLAIDVLKRQIKDIFILEHRDCGAYQHYHPNHRKPYDEDQAGQNLEEKHHREQAFLLAKTIRDFCLKQQQAALDEERQATTEAAETLARKRLAAWQGIHVKCFLMDLQGEVKHLCEGPERKTAKRPKSSKAASPRSTSRA
jgi:carbonic anhydrase